MLHRTIQTPASTPLTSSIAAMVAALIASCLILPCLILTACGDEKASGGRTTDDPPASRTRPLFVCTTPIVSDVVRSVVGEHAEVTCLITPGVDPHLWTPTRTDVLQLLDADAVFMNGLLLEGRIGDSIARVESLKKPVLRVAQTIDRDDLLTDPARMSYFDPHIWMDPVLWARTAAPVAEVAGKLMPQHAAEFDANATRYRERALALESECERILATIPLSARTLVSSHDAYHYFGRRFSLEVRGLQGLSTESEASIADVEQLVAEISQKRIPTAFVETTVSDRTIRALVEGCGAMGHDLRIGAPLYSDSLGRLGTTEGTWEGMLLYNARTIADNLGASR